MKNNFQKRLIISASLSLIFTFSMMAQTDLGTHFMNNSLSQSNLSNPALFSDFSVIVSLPSVYADLSNPNFTLDDVLSETGNGSSIQIDNLLSKLGSDGLSFQANGAVETFGLNIQHDKYLFNFHHAVRVFNQTSLSKDLVQFVWGGHDQFVGDPVNIDIQQNLLAYQELGLAFGYRVNDNFSFGTRIKWLKGLATLQTPSATASINGDIGQFQLSTSSNFKIQTGGLPISDLEDLGQLSFSDIDMNWLVQNNGISFDFGINYQHDDWGIEASFNNIGGITWKENAYNFESQGVYQFDGFDLEKIVDGSEISTVEIIDSISNLFQLEERETTLKTATPTTAHVSFRYDIANRLYVSPFFFLQNFNGNSSTAVGLNIKKDFADIFTIGTQYAYQGNHNIGLMSSLRLGPLQVYAVTDNIISIFDNRKTQKFNIRTGVNLVFGNKYEKPLKCRKF